MKIQKQLSKKRGDKKYYRFVVNIPSDIMEQAGFKEGEELDFEAKKGEIKIKRK